MKIVLDPNPAKCQITNDDGTELPFYVRSLSLNMNATEVPELTLVTYCKPGSTVQIDGADITVIGVDTDENLHPDS